MTSLDLAPVTLRVVEARDQVGFAGLDLAHALADRVGFGAGRTHRRAQRLALGDQPAAFGLVQLTVAAVGL